MEIELLRDSEIAELETSMSEAEWNRVCDCVKQARGGNYPPDWFPRVLVSGIASRAQIRWAGSRE